MRRPSYNFDPCQRPPKSKIGRLTSVDPLASRRCFALPSVVAVVEATTLLANDGSTKNVLTAAMMAVRETNLMLEIEQIFLHEDDLLSRRRFLATSTECSAGSNDHFVVGVLGVPSLVQFDGRPLGCANFQYKHCEITQPFNATITQPCTQQNNHATLHGT
jgi:hypothetical protein